MKVKCFGIAKEICGMTEIDLTGEPTVLSVQDLRQSLNERYPGLLEIKSYMIAVNQSYGEAQQQISQTDEIAIIPPVSGG